MHLVREQAPTGPDPEAVALTLIDRLIEEAALAQRDNREKDAAIEELQREVHMRDVEISDLRRELDEAEARYDRLRWGR